MKRTAIVVMVLAAAAFAQSQTPSQPSTAAAQTTPAQPAQAAGKQPLQAKTQPEYDAYNAAHAQVHDPLAMEKAAADFATKFPESDLRVLLYRDAMKGYQRANNADKMLAMGRQVLKLDENDPDAMIGVAEVLTERTTDKDLDKEQRLDEAAKLAEHALQTIDTNIVVPAGAAPEQVTAYKEFLRSSAYAIIGTQRYNKENYKDAEDAFRKSIEAFPSELDPIVVLRLSLSLDKQQKYSEALKEANHAVDLTASQADTSVGIYARQERDRLIQLTGGTVPVPAPPTAAKPATGTQPAQPKN